MPNFNRPVRDLSKLETLSRLGQQAVDLSFRNDLEQAKRQREIERRANVSRIIQGLQTETAQPNIDWRTHNRTVATAGLRLRQLGEDVDSGFLRGFYMDEPKTNIKTEVKEITGESGKPELIQIITDEKNVLNKDYQPTIKRLGQSVDKTLTPTELAVIANDEKDPRNAIAKATIKAQGDEKIRVAKATRVPTYTLSLKENDNGTYTMFRANSKDPNDVQIVDSGIKYKPADIAKINENAQKIDAFQDSLEQYEQVLGNVDSGRIGGTIAKGQALIGVNDPARTAAGLRNSIAGAIARVLNGEVGVLTDQDVQRAISLLPTEIDTESERASKFNEIKQLLKNRVDAYQKAAEGKYINKKEETNKKTYKFNSYDPEKIYSKEELKEMSPEAKAQMRKHLESQ